MRLLENSWSEMLIMDQIHQRMHNQLPDETTLANGQKFELLSLALLGVPSMSEAFNDLTTKLSTLKFDSADYVCLKFVLLLNPGANNPDAMYHIHGEGGRGAFLLFIYLRNKDALSFRVHSHRLPCLCYHSIDQR